MNGEIMESRKVNRPTYLLEGFTSPAYDVGDRNRWSEQLRAEEQEMTDRMVRLAEHMAAGTPPDDPAVLDEVDLYYHWAGRYGGTNAAMLTAIGQICVDDEQVRGLFEKVAAGLAAYQRSAIDAYVGTRLSEGGA